MIDPLVTKWCQHFAGESALLPIYVSSVIFAEGGMGRIVKAVQCSEPTVTTLDEAVQITCRSVVHRLVDNPGNDPHRTIAVLGNHWAPLGVANDPHDLNANWIPNATEEFDRLLGEHHAAAQ